MQEYTSALVLMRQFSTSYINSEQYCFIKIKTSNLKNNKIFTPLFEKYREITICVPNNCIAYNAVSLENELSHLLDSIEKK